MALFRYSITNRACDKDDYKPSERTVDEFVRTMLRIGVRPGAKDGPGIIGATFKPHSRLEQKNVTSVTALILDVDGKFKRDGVQVTEPVDPDWFISRFPFRGIAHTSYNHSPAHPKFRVILPLEKPISVEQFKRLWAWAFVDRADRKIDPSCKNPDRMFYLPRGPEEALKAGWPWVRELHGPVLSLDHIPADFVVPEDLAGVAPAKPKKRQGLHLAPPECRFAPADADLLLKKFMETPIVKWAMEHPSDVSREVWRGLATNLAAIALERETDEDFVEECLTAFHEISEQDGDRYSAGDTTRAFHDAMKSARQYGPMTFERMCENGAPDIVCVADFKTPIAAARREARPPAAGAAAPAGASAPPEGTVPGTIQGAVSAGETSGTVAASAPTATTPGTISGAASDASEEEDEEDELGDIFDHKPDEFLFDTQNGYLMRDKNGDWDTVTPIKTQAFDQMLKSLGCPPKSVDTFKARIKFINERKPFYDRPTEHRIVVDGVPYFNTYKPTKLVPAAGNWDDIRELLLNLVGDDPEALEFLLDWIAAPLQSLRYNGKPMKMGTAPVFQGEQGSGKGTFDLIMGLIYGASNCALMGQDSLDSRFNAELIDKLFVTANEVISSSNRSMEVANKLKMWVTDPMIPIEEKFQGMVLRPNNFNIIFTSNDDRPVIIEKTDRRYPVFRSKKFDRSVSTRIHQDIAGGKNQVAAFFDVLLKRQTKIQFGDMFETAARKQVVLSSVGSDERFALEVREEGWRSVAEPWRSAGNPNNPRLSTTDDDGVIAATLHEVYQDFCRRHGVKPCGSNKFIKTLEAEFNVKLKLVRKRLNGVPQRIWYGFPMNPEGEVIPFPAPQEHEQKPTGTSDAPDFT